MYQRVEQYLLGRGEKERLELARRCLYFKSEQTLSREQLRPRDDWKREVLRALTKDWAGARANWSISIHATAGRSTR